MQTLDQNDQSDSGPEAPLPTQCPLCGTDLNSDHPGECPKCDWVSGYRHRTTGGTPSDLAACLMSLLPGLGHLYKGHRSGWFFLAGTAVAIFLAGVAATPTMGMGLILLPCYWLWVMVQAYWLEDLSK